jgi:hypothetical protein
MNLLSESLSLRVRVRAKRDDRFLCKILLSRTDRTLTPTPLPEGEGLQSAHVM